jgi:uncharacterized membrane protein
MQAPWHLYLMAGIYLLAGLNHFRAPRLYTRIMPPLFPAPRALNYLSGAAEVFLAIGLCIPALTHIAAWGIITLLIAVFPANVYMLTSKKAGLGVPQWLLWLRLPLQAVLVYWAYLYT